MVLAVSEPGRKRIRLSGCPGRWRRCATRVSDWNPQAFEKVGVPRVPRDLQVQRFADQSECSVNQTNGETGSGQTVAVSAWGRGIPVVQEETWLSWNWNILLQYRNLIKVFTCCRSLHKRFKQSNLGFPRRSSPSMTSLRAIVTRSLKSPPMESLRVSLKRHGLTGFLFPNPGFRQWIIWILTFLDFRVLTTSYQGYPCPQLRGLRKEDELKELVDKARATCWPQVWLLGLWTLWIPDLDMNISNTV